MGYPHIRGTVVAAEWQPSFIHLWPGIGCPDFLRPFEDTPPPSAIVTLEHPYAHSGVAVGFFCALCATPLPWPSYVLKFTSNRFQNMEEPKMYDRRSVCALNKKKPDAIVLPDADGNLICLTCADFTDDAEFRRWKRWSDQDFHAEDKTMWRKATTPHLWTWFRKPPLLFPMRRLWQRKGRSEKIRFVVRRRRFLGSEAYCLGHSFTDSGSIASKGKQRAKSPKQKASHSRLCLNRWSPL